MACSLVGHHAEVQKQCKSSSRHYSKAVSAGQMNDSTGEWLRTTVGVRQRSLFCSTLFHIYLETIMFDALEEHEGDVSRIIS